MIGPGSSRSEIAEYINCAFQSTEIVEICHAIGAATRLHSISDIASKAGIERTSLYRAFAGESLPKFSTVVSVLDAMGLQLRVTEVRGRRARLAKLRTSSDLQKGAPPKKAVT